MAATREPHVNRCPRNNSLSLGEDVLFSESIIILQSLRYATTQYSRQLGLPGRRRSAPGRSNCGRRGIDPDLNVQGSLAGFTASVDQSSRSLPREILTRVSQLRQVATAFGSALLHSGRPEPFYCRSERTIAWGNRRTILDIGKRVILL